MATERKERFRQQFQQYYPVLCRIAHGYVADPDDCEDIVQDLFVSVWSRGKDELPDDELGAYLKMAVRNNCLTFLRNRRSSDTVSVDEKPSALADAATDDTATTDYAAILGRVLDQMPPKCREVFVMCKLQKMRYREIADALNISEKTVENHIGKAIRIIRDYGTAHPLLLLLLASLQIIATDV
ncbi:RNA polymerase sigma-70 factor [Prevotella dentasini]|uniref:RNA polymerase sigma-70 factor n=1 Tax=Prevotella dentasini TaxID=589537 RepID=UPI00046AF6B9|nr:RNA polymerase sigma-70 factor [Prevotella dentasini]